MRVQVALTFDDMAVYTVKFFALLVVGPFRPARSQPYILVVARDRLPKLYPVL